MSTIRGQAHTRVFGIAVGIPRRRERVVTEPGVRAGVGVDIVLEELDLDVPLVVRSLSYMSITFPK